MIGFRDELTLLYPFSDLAGIRHGNRVRLARTSRWLRVGERLLGRVIDAGRQHGGRPAAAGAGRAGLLQLACRRILAPGRGSASRWPPASARSTAC